MAASFSNTLPSSFGGVPVTTMKPKRPVSWSKDYAPSQGLISPKAPISSFAGSKQSAAPISAPRTMQISAAPAAQSYAPSAGVQGLLKPDVSALNAQLKEVQNGLATLQQEREAQSFPNMVNQVQQASRPSPVQTGLVQNIADAAGGFSGIGKEAQRISEEYGKRIANVGQLGAGAVAGALSTGTDVVGSGNAAIASQSASSRMSALASAQDAALKGTGQQLDAQSGQVGAFGTALGGANTQQAQQLSGLTSAAGFGQPSGNYPFVFDPLTGQFNQAGGGGGGGISNPQQIAQALMSEQMTWEQAKAALSYLGPTSESMLSSAVLAAGGNPLQLQTQGASQQSNLGTQQTAQTDIARSGLEKTTQDYVAMTSAAQFADQQAAAVTNILGAAGLNDATSKDYNKVLNNLKGRFGDTNYAALNTALIEARAAYANLLSTGGQTPTGNEGQALATLDIDQSAAAINSSIQQLEAAVARRLQAQNSAVQQYQQNLGGGQPQQQQQQKSAPQNVEFYQKPDGSWAYR